MIASISKEKVSIINLEILETKKTTIRPYQLLKIAKMSKVPKDQEESNKRRKSIRDIKN